MWIFVLRGQEDLTDEEKFKKKLEESQGVSHEGREQELQRSLDGMVPRIPQERPAGWCGMSEEKWLWEEGQKNRGGGLNCSGEDTGFQ